MSATEDRVGVGDGTPPPTAETRAPPDGATPAAAQMAVALAALPIQVMVFDAAHRLVLANDAVWRELGFDPAVAPPGTPLADILRLLAFGGVYGPGDPEARAATALRIDRSRPSRRIVRTASGRSFEIHTIPFPDDGGGFLSCAVEVTALLAAEAEAAARARRLEGVLARLHGGIALYDASQQLVLFNPAYAAHVGLDAGQLRPGMSYAEVLRALVAAGEFANADPDELMRIRAGFDRSRLLVHQRERPSGEVLRFISQPVAEGGSLIEVDDVTPLKRAEDEARRRAALLDGVLAALPHGVAVWGPDRRVAMFNTAYARIMEGAPIAAGDTLAEVLRRRAEAGEFGPGDPEEILRRQSAFALNRPQARQRVRPNGTAIDIRTEPLPDGGHISVVTDITALHRAETEASRRAAILEVMLDNTRHGICLFDRERRVVAANAMASALTGHAPGAMVPGRHLEDLVRSLRDRGEFGEGEEAARYAGWMIARDRSMPSRHIRRRPDGTMLEVMTDPTPDGGFVMSYSDVTGDHRVRAELQGAKEAAEAASQAKSRFLATMSHELRTPLNAVIGFSEALMAAATAEPDTAAAVVPEYARAIHDAGRHLLALIEDILDVARAGGTRFAVTEAPLDPAALAEGVVRVMQAAAGAAGLSLTLRLPPGLPWLRADERRLRQVLINLISNAVKFTPAGGSVVLSATVEETTGDLLLRVSDTGMGMPEKELARVFEPFIQLEDSLARRFPGSGLGLPLSRALAEAHGGTLTLESAPGAGTIATLRLPRACLLLPPPPADGGPTEGALPA